MKVFLPNESKMQVGGGWSFLNSLKKGMGDLITDDYEQSDTLFVSGASMVKPEVIEDAKRSGRRIILRCDNILRHSRNGGKGMERMRRMAAVSDLVVYQCEWAKSILDDFLGHPNSTIIYNGVDLNVFKPDGPKIKFGESPVYLYASASKGENKGWNTAWYDYQQVQKDYPSALLLIVGNVSTDVKDNKFDFFQGEHFKYLGMINNPGDMAIAYRSADRFYAVAQFDCYSNAVLEALACGLELVSISHTGGMPELLKNWSKGREFNSLERMTAQYEESIMAL